MYINDDLFIEEFDEFNIEIEKDNEDYFEKLREICKNHSLDASDIASEWMAYSHTHKNCKISLTNLDAMDRYIQLKRASKQKKISQSSNKKSFNLSNVDHNDQDDDVLGSYSTPNGKPSLQKRQHTPDNPSLKRRIGKSPAVFSPSSISPARSTPSQKYSSRLRPGEVVCKHGEPTNVQWKSARHSFVSVKPYDETTALVKKFNFMFQKMTDKNWAMNEHIDELSDCIQKHYDIEEYGYLSHPSQEPIIVVGRIDCDSNGKLNAKSVILDELEVASNILIDLTSVSQYSLFPGQIVAIEGTNPTGTQFIATKIYDNKALPLPSTLSSLSSTLTVLTACGPFSTIDNLGYEPFADLLNIIQRDTPDVCILIGPFVDIKNPSIEKCEIEETFEEFFNTFMRNLQDSLQSITTTKFILVPSHRDAHHQPVYPQPPFEIPSLDKEKFYFASDPCMINIDGVVFGITATDILFHLGMEEISFPPGSSDRLARLSKHLLTQQRFYPLYPSSEEVNIDYDHWDVYGRMTISPHVLIIPSDLRYFLKDVEGTFCMNPGRLTKMQVGGTYCRMKIEKSDKSSIVESTVAEIIRI